MRRAFSMFFKLLHALEQIASGNCVQPSGICFRLFPVACLTAINPLRFCPSNRRAGQIKDLFMAVKKSGPPLPGSCAAPHAQESSSLRQARTAPVLRPPLMGYRSVKNLFYAFQACFFVETKYFTLRRRRLIMETSKRCLHSFFTAKLPP